MHEECFKTRIVEIPRKAECFSTLCYFAGCQMSLLCTWHLFTSCSGTVLTVGKLTPINGPFSDFWPREQHFTCFRLQRASYMVHSFSSTIVTSRLHSRMRTSHTHTLTQTRARTHARKHAHTHKRAHARTHASTHAHTHTHTQFPCLMDLWYTPVPGLYIQSKLSIAEYSVSRPSLLFWWTFRAKPDRAQARKSLASSLVNASTRSYKQMELINARKTSHKHNGKDLTLRRYIWWNSRIP